MGTVPGDPFTDKEALDLIRTYYGIPKNQRRHIFDLARLLGEASLPARANAPPKGHPRHAPILAKVVS